MHNGLNRGTKVGESRVGNPFISILHSYQLTRGFSPLPETWKFSILAVPSFTVLQYKKNLNIKARIKLLLGHFENERWVMLA